MLLPALCFCVAILSCCWIKVRKAARSVSLGLPDGPQPFPFFGNLGTLYRLSVAPREICGSFKAQYGDMTTVWMGSWPTVFINSPQVAHELLQKGGAVDTASRPMHNDFRHANLPDRIVVAPADDTFRNQRKIYHTVLSKSASASFHQGSDHESLLLIRKLLDEPLSFLFHCERFAINVIFRVLYGRRLRDQEDREIAELYEIWKTMYLYFLPGTCIFDMFPIFLRLPQWMQPWYWILSILKHKEARTQRKYIEQAKREAAASQNLECFANKLREKKGSDGFDNEAHMNMLAMLLGAGSDTTSAMMQLFLKTMALHPEKVAIAHAELDRVVGGDRLPAYEDAQNLPYIRALIKEVHRWAPIAVVGIPHATTKALNYRGYTFPKGTILFPNIPALNMDAARYKDPSFFEPLRFVHDSQDSVSSAQSSSYQDRDHANYGFGRRFCPGAYVADYAIFMAISRILWAFDLKKIPGSDIRMDQERGTLFLSRNYLWPH
ncbi:cytochrome P450 [Acephala macrosclerotiorum]|nr:cytochrome P450 [Acephala macrosclerotiorum]